MASKSTLNLLAEERLELENGVDMTSAPSTPLMAVLLGPGGRVETVNSTEFTWTEEDRVDVTDPDGIKEISTYVAETLGARVTRKNFCQIFKKTVGVSDTVNALNLITVGSELVHQVSLARDYVLIQAERQFLFGAKKAEDVASGRQTDGIANQVGYTLDITPVVGQPEVALTKEHIENVLKYSFERGYIQRKTLLCNANQKKVIDALYAVGNQVHYTPGTNVMGDPMASAIITPYGEVSILLDINMPQDEIYIVDLTKLVLKRIQAFEVKDVSTNDETAVKKAVIGQYGLKLESRFHAGKIIGLKK